MSDAPSAALMRRIAAGTAEVGVIGLGYVGLPLALAFSRAGFPTLGFDIDVRKTEAIRAGRSYLTHIDDTRIEEALGSGRLDSTTDFGRLDEMDALLICVPTPLDEHRAPNLRYVRNTVQAISAKLRSGQLVVLESTTYPGTTAEVVRPMLEAGGLTVGRDVFLAFAPEREDPGNLSFQLSGIPKVVGADDPHSAALARALYAPVVTAVVPVSSAATAEAVKLTENIFRAVNIALVNELKLIFTPMGVDIWEVVDAAKTKPFGYMPFYPGPGLGGHCIPIDPFYLTWKARAHGINTRFIELAGEINVAMPDYVVSRLAEALNDRSGLALKGARILLVGVAYKPNVNDMRESPALTLIERLGRRRADVDYYDPLVPEIPQTRDFGHLAGRRSVAWDPAAFAGYDAALVCTDHAGIDWTALVGAVPLVVDSRNATRDVTEHRDRIVLA